MNQQQQQQQHSNPVRPILLKNNIHSKSQAADFYSSFNNPFLCEDIKSTSYYRDKMLLAGGDIPSPGTTTVSVNMAFDDQSSASSANSTLRHAPQQLQQSSFALSPLPISQSSSSTVPPIPINSYSSQTTWYPSYPIQLPVGQYYTPSVAMVPPPPNNYPTTTATRDKTASVEDNLSIVNELNRPSRFERRNTVADTPISNLNTNNNLSSSSAVAAASDGPPQINIVKVDAECVARQITLIEMEYFIKIRTEEFLTFKWTGSEKMKCAPNIVASIRWFNQLTFWVRQEILAVTLLKERSEVLAYFIKVAKKLVNQNNLYSAKAVITALQSHCIHRLKQTFSALSSKDRSKYRRLQELFSEENNHTRLRAYMENMKVPCIPYLGICLTDLIHIDVAHPRQRELESPCRTDKLNFILRRITECQESHYSFDVDDRIRRYLLSRAYIEELQCFLEDDMNKKSEQLERPHDSGDGLAMTTTNNSMPNATTTTSSTTTTTMMMMMMMNNPTNQQSNSSSSPLNKKLLSTCAATSLEPLQPIRTFPPPPPPPLLSSGIVSPPQRQTPSRPSLTSSLSRSSDYSLSTSRTDILNASDTLQPTILVNNSSIVTTESCLVNQNFSSSSTSAVRLANLLPINHPRHNRIAAVQQQQIAPTPSNNSSVVTTTTSTTTASGHRKTRSVSGPNVIHCLDSLHPDDSASSTSNCNFILDDNHHHHHHHHHNLLHNHPNAMRHLLDGSLLHHHLQTHQQQQQQQQQHYQQQRPPTTSSSHSHHHYHPPLPPPLLPPHPSSTVVSSPPLLPSQPHFNSSCSTLGGSSGVFFSASQNSSQGATGASSTLASNCGLPLVNNNVLANSTSSYRGCCTAAGNNSSVCPGSGGGGTASESGDSAIHHLHNDIFIGGSIPSSTGNIIATGSGSGDNIWLTSTATDSSSLSHHPPPLLLPSSPLSSSFPLELSPSISTGEVMQLIAQGCLQRKTIWKKGKKPLFHLRHRYWVTLVESYCDAYLIYFEANSTRATKRDQFSSNECQRQCLRNVSLVLSERELSQIVSNYHLNRTTAATTNCSSSSSPPPPPTQPLSVLPILAPTTILSPTVATLLPSSMEQSNNSSSFYLFDPLVERGYKLRNIGSFYRGSSAINQQQQHQQQNYDDNWIRLICNSILSAQHRRQEAEARSARDLIELHDDDDDDEEFSDPFNVK